MALRIPLLFLMALAAGCSSSRPYLPVTQDEKDFQAAASSLRLELARDVPTVLQAGRTVTATFLLRNEGAAGIDLCLGRGVSTFIQADADAVWRVLRWYGQPWSGRCRSRLHLEPGAAHELVEPIALPRKLPQGAAKLRSMIAVELPAGCDERSGCPHGFVSGLHEVSVSTKPGSVVAALDP